MATEFITDVVDPAELTGYVREQVDGDLPFGGLLPPVQIESIEFELTNLDSVTGKVAKYRSWDTAPPIDKRPGVTIVGGEIPPLGLSMRLNEREILQLNQLRAGINRQTNQRVVDTIYNDAVNMARAVQNRITLAQGELLTTGKVTLTELGDVETGSALVATFDVPAAHLNVTASPLWSSHATATPVANLKAWEATFRSNNGGLNPEAWLVSTEVMSDLALNAQIMTLAGGTSGVTPGVITDTTVQAVVRAAGVAAPLIVQDVERPTLDGSSTARVINARKVIGVRPSVLGSTFYGISANASTLAGNGTIEFTDAPGIIAFATRSVRPPEVLTTAEGVALPVLRDPKALFVATV